MVKARGEARARTLPAGHLRPTGRGTTADTEPPLSHRPWPCSPPTSAEVNVPQELVPFVMHQKVLIDPPLPLRGWLLG